MQKATLIVLGLILAVVAPMPGWCADKPAAKSPAADKKTNDADESAGIVGSAPAQVGDVEPAFWGNLTEDQQAGAIARLKSFAQKSAQTLKHPLHLQESRMFLLYSDLLEVDSGRYLLLLERMYGKLADLFGIDKGQSLWRGKALVFVFARIEDYRLYERLVEGNDPGGSFGMTHCYGDGMVHIAFYRYPDAAQFEHLLVHESVHGFLHRYHTPVRIPSWANEGLADELASELVAADQRRPRFVRELARASVAQHNNTVGDFFTARHIDGWQYPVAETLCAWMIHHHRRGYLDFINGIKDGQSWQESLKVNFKMTQDDLIREFGKAMKIKSLRAS